MPKKSISPCMIRRECQQCGAIFFAYPSVIRAGYAKFCGKPCQYAAVTQPILERFWRSVQKTDDCWVWIGLTDRNGYGRLGRGGYRGGMLFAHRFSWEIHFGAPTAHVLHHCDNPPCVRPEHLFLGTDADNVSDKIRKGRQPWKVSPAQREAIAAEYLRGGVTQKALAHIHGIAPSRISQIVVAHRHVS